MEKTILAVLVLALTIWSQNIFAQDAESYTKVANHLVELINAADYSGVENLFNKEMSKALPVKKATEFFAGMKAQFGRIQKLDEPRHSAGWTVFPAHFERGLMDMSLALDDENKIAGLNFKPRAAASEAAPKKQLTELSLPFKGKWLVGWGGDTKEFNQQLLGKCGNSGNSSEPHLHYHLQHSPIFQDALGIKILFQKVSLTKDGQTETKINYSPVKGDIISPE